MSVQPNTCKPRFKGVENFLRRVAFNLGNSPSQTEVKIISCIPIDVTDLQQKIINLEKQLDEARAQAVCTSNAGGTPPVFQTALCRAPCQGQPSCRSCCKPTETRPAHYAEQCEQCFLGDSRSTVYNQIPPQPHPPPIIRPFATVYNQCDCFSTDHHSSDVSVRNDHKADRKSLFKKSKKKTKDKKKKDKPKTQFVYYAQTTTGPFNDYLETRTQKSPSREGEIMSRSYISEMLRKQYAPVPIAQDHSTTSQFSSPVCRDVEQTCPLSNPYESDLCSCCHGTFHNIDHHMATHNYTNVLNTFPAYSYKECLNNASFYDSSLYDMVPVRDKPASTASPVYKSPKRKVPKNALNATYNLEKVRSKTRYLPLNKNHYTRMQSVANNTQRTPVKLYSTKEKVRRESLIEKDIKIGRLKHTETSNSCCIDCGDVYIKRIHANSKMQASIKPNKSPSCKNAECLTNILNDTECQTTTTQSVQIDHDLLEEKKTEETLNQIKSILQSVLTEVKTSSLPKKTSEVKDKPTKDAVVQKGMSQGNMPGCSSLLHSFSYSPYNMNPYMASCSRQMNSRPCCFPTLPYPSAKCMQNFPVFIQTPGRHMCAGCYRNSSHVPKVPPPRPATTAATNTATNTDSKERSKETEKLIKEIYKSMAVNMEFPTKDTSASEYNDLRSTPGVSVNKSLYRPSVLNDGMKKFMKSNGSRSMQKSSTPITAFNSKLMSNTLSMRSQIVSTTDTEHNARNNRIENYLENIDAHRKRQTRIEEEREYEEQTPETTASDDEASYSDASVRETYVQKVEEPIKKPEKIGLFSKMLNSVKLFNAKSKKNKNKKKKEEEVQVENVEEEESDGNSDDYQTIYSQRVDRRPRYVPHAVRSPHKLKAHSKISYSRHMRDRNQERSKRPPYMEQEYRRHWNERLMFQESRNRYSSDSPFSKETPQYARSKETPRYARSKETPRYSRDPVYWQNYEARSALISNKQQAVDSVVTDPNHRPTFTREDLIRSIDNEGEPKVTTATKGLAWLKKHKLGIRCGEQWKKLILEG